MRYGCSVGSWVNSTAAALEFLVGRARQSSVQKKRPPEVLVSGGHAATTRVEAGWNEHRMRVPLQIEEAPFRDLGDGRLLHNRRALYVKRLLLFEPRLFEPRVILASVPYRMD
jgi:hypothetical protein